MYKNILPQAKITNLNYNFVDFILPRCKKSTITDKLNKQISDNEYDVAHVFSGGSLVLHTLLENNKLQYNKLIFDSSPLFPTPNQLSNYICEICNTKNDNIKNSLQYIIPKIWTADSIISNIKTYNWKKNYESYNNWLFSNKKSLCLLMKNDKLIDYNAVNNWLLYSNSKLIYFDKGKHVQLYKYEKEKYIENILQYIN